MQAAQDINVGARLSKTQYQYTLVDVDNEELDHWASILLQKLQGLPELTSVASDQQSAGQRCPSAAEPDRERHAVDCAVGGQPPGPVSVRDAELQSRRENCDRLCGSGNRQS